MTEPATSAVKVRINRTADRDFIAALSFDPLIWPFISDDGCEQKLEVVDRLLGFESLILKAEDEAPLGLWIAFGRNFVTCELHFCVVPSRFGGKAYVTNEVCRWIFSNTRFKKIVTEIPRFNERAIRHIRKAGFIHEGVNRVSFLKDGVLHDQIVFGMGG